MTDGWSSEKSPKSYEVGYGKPPQHTRFCLGKSGNPKGRPRRRKTARHMLEEALNSACTVTERGVRKRMSQQQLIYKVIVANSVQGNPKFSAQLFKLMREHGIMDDDFTTNEMLIKFVEPE